MKKRTLKQRASDYVSRTLPCIDLEPGEPTDGELLDALEPLLSFWGQGSSSEVYGFELEEIEDFRITVDEVEKVSEDVAERMVAGDFVTLRDLARAIIAQRGGKE